MTESDIKIDKDGVWYYRGAHMFRKDILCIFFEHLQRDDCGRYFIRLNDETCYLDVEDTAFVISAVFHTKDDAGDEDQLEVLQSDDSMEKLDLNSLFVGADNVMYCKIKQGRFTARFTRKSYYQLAQFIEADEENGLFYVFLNNKKYYIHDQKGHSS